MMLITFIEITFLCFLPAVLLLFVLAYVQNSSKPLVNPISDQSDY